MKRWFTMFAVMIVALGSIALAGCTPEEGGDEETGDATTEESAAVTTEDGAGAEAAATEGS